MGAVTARHPLNKRTQAIRNKAYFFIGMPLEPTQLLRVAGIGGLHQVRYLLDDDLFDGRSEGSWELPGHCVSPFVAAFSQDSKRWDVSENVIGIARDPGCLPAMLAFETQRIIG